MKRKRVEVDYEKTHKIIRENDRFSKRMDKKRSRDLKGCSYYENEYKEILDLNSTDKLPKNKYANNVKNLCAIDGTVCNGPCKEKYTLASGEVNCGELINKK